MFDDNVDAETGLIPVPDDFDSGGLETEEDRLAASAIIWCIGIMEDLENAGLVEGGEWKLSEKARGFFERIKNARPTTAQIASFCVEFVDDDCQEEMLFLVTEYRDNPEKTLRELKNVQAEMDKAKYN